MNESQRGPSSDPSRPIPHIGAFVLETLTLGMYGEPRHTLREYIQNSFDSIRAAQRTKFLAGRGRVDISIGAEAITIRDNGLGVRAALAWSTLTSVGASKKDRQRDAGFRGIGRLAGMAYCDQLTFKTTFPGETLLSTVSFDCRKLLAAMDPDDGGEKELAKLLAEAVTFEQHDAASSNEEHYFEVTLSGLQRAPDVLTNMDEVCGYLSETVPVDFPADWAHREAVESDYKSYFGSPMETIDVFVSSGDQVTQIFKPYGDTYERAQGIAQLESVKFQPGDENRYWGWIGYLSGSGAVTQARTRGLRVRVRNIQVDGTEILESLFASVKPSYGRFSAYYVGEIHIDPERVIPNARRDGFEETAEWISIKKSLIWNVCDPLAKGAYLASQAEQTDVKKLVEHIKKLVESSQDLANNSRASYDQVVDMMNSAKRLRRRATAALKVVADLDEAAIETATNKAETTGTQLEQAAKDVESVESQARMLIGRFLDEDERLSALKQRLREEIIVELLDILNAFVDPTTYQKIKRQLMKGDRQ